MTEKTARRLADLIESMIDEKVDIAILAEQESGYGSDKQRDSDEKVAGIKRQIVRVLKDDKPND